MAKNPTVAAILNFFVWGLGYLYLGQKTNFGVILILAVVVSAYGAFVERAGIATSIGALIASVAFAYDAYSIAKTVQPVPEAKP